MVIYGVYKLIYGEHYKELVKNSLFVNKEEALEFTDNKNSQSKTYKYIVQEVDVIENKIKCGCGKELSQHSKDIKNYNCCDCMTKKLIGNSFFDKNL